MLCSSPWEDKEKLGRKEEVIFTGALRSTSQNGESVMTEYASWIVLERDAEDELLVESWRVFSDTSKLGEAIGEMMRVE